MERNKVNDVYYHGHNSPTKKTYKYKHERSVVTLIAYSRNNNKQNELHTLLIVKLALISCENFIKIY